MTNAGQNSVASEPELLIKLQSISQQKKTSKIACVKSFGQFK
jgi:hypothetical protein